MAKHVGDTCRSRKVNGFEGKTDQVLICTDVLFLIFFILISDPLFCNGSCPDDRVNKDGVGVSPRVIHRMKLVRSSILAQMFIFHHLIPMLF